MSLISRLTTWVSGQLLKSGDLNSEFNNITNLFNNLDGATTAWTNVKTGALNVTGASITLDNTTFNAAGYLIGSIVQMQVGSTVSDTSTTSNTYQATGVTLSITPKATTHKVLVMASGAFAIGTTGVNAFATIQRGATNLFGASGAGMMRVTIAGLTLDIATTTMVILDSPSSVAAQTYAVYIKNSDNATTISFPAGSGTGVTGYILAVEIAA